MNNNEKNVNGDKNNISNDNNNSNTERKITISTEIT